jgi:hypothetical protein
MQRLGELLTAVTRDVRHLDDRWVEGFPPPPPSAEEILGWQTMLARLPADEILTRLSDAAGLLRGHLLRAFAKLREADADLEAQRRMMLAEAERRGVEEEEEEKRAAKLQQAAVVDSRSQSGTGTVARHRGRSRSPAGTGTAATTPGGTTLMPAVVHRAYGGGASSQSPNRRSAAASPRVGGHHHTASAAEAAETAPATPSGGVVTVRSSPVGSGKSRHGTSSGTTPKTPAERKRALQARLAAAQREWDEQRHAAVGGGAASRGNVIPVVTRTRSPSPVARHRGDSPDNSQGRRLSFDASTHHQAAIVAASNTSTVNTSAATSMINHSQSGPHHQQQQHHHHLHHHGGRTSLRAGASRAPVSSFLTESSAFAAATGATVDALCRALLAEMRRALVRKYAGLDTGSLGRAIHTKLAQLTASLAGSRDDRDAARAARTAVLAFADQYEGHILRAMSRRGGSDDDGYGAGIDGSDSDDGSIGGGGGGDDNVSFTLGSPHDGGHLLLEHPYNNNNHNHHQQHGSLPVPFEPMSSPPPSNIAAVARATPGT